MDETSVNHAVAEWFAGDKAMLGPCTDEPEVAWAAILIILERDLSNEEKAMLAGGPLEALLSLHGSEFIDRVEQQAKENPAFNHLLGGVWKGGISPGVWERVQKARKTVW